MKWFAFLLCLIGMMCIISCSGTTRSYEKIGEYKYEVLTREAEQPEVITKEPDAPFFSWFATDEEDEEEIEAKKELIPQQEVKQSEQKPESEPKLKLKLIGLRRERLQLRRNRYLLLQGK